MMTSMEWLQVALTFVGGFGLFLFGMEYMGEGLQKAAGSKMKHLLGVLTGNRFLGVLVGAGITALIQSSSATTVMVVGFVNAGLMSLKQAVGVIMGANVGTTITGWIVALGEWTRFLKPDVLAPICIITGIAFMMFVKKMGLRHFGQILFGFGALFWGLENMSLAAKPLQNLQSIKNLFITLGGSPLLGIVTGAAVTALIQSSSASVGILQALATASLVPWNSAIYIILGQNIGTCVTATLSSLGAGINAKRAAMIHFLFNLIGSVLFGAIAYVLLRFPFKGAGNQLITVTEISMMHTIFNLMNTLLLFPFANGLIQLAELLVKGDLEEKQNEVIHLDERMLETPALAIESVINEVVRMGQMAEKNIKVAVRALFEKKQEQIEEVFQREQTINQFQKEINYYIVKLSNVPLSEDENRTVTSLFHMVSDIERVGDHSENIAELVQNMIEGQFVFSQYAKEELECMAENTISCYEKAVKAYKMGDQQLAREVILLEVKNDRLQQRSRSKHMKRLAKNQCEAGAGIIFLDAVSNMERISDHAANIAKNIISKNRISIED